MKYLGAITNDYDLVNKKYVDDRIQTVPTNISAFINDVGYITTYTETDPTVPSWAKQSSKPTYTATEVGAVPTSRTINSKALTSNITLTAANVGAVPTSRTVNGKTLSGNITLTFADVGAVPTSRTVNGKSLSSNISLVSTDLGINDYVIEQTTSGDWTYTKWNSGKAEAWARLAGANSVAFTTSQQSDKFYTNANWISKTINLPNGLFSGAPVVTVEVENNGYLHSTVAGVSADGSYFTLRCWSPYSHSFNITNISIYAKGKWQ